MPGVNPCRFEWSPNELPDGYYTLRIASSGAPERLAAERTVRVAKMSTRRLVDGLDAARQATQSLDGQIAAHPDYLVALAATGTDWTPRCFDWQ